MKSTLSVCLLLALGWLALLPGCSTTHIQDTGVTIQVLRLERVADGTSTVQMLLINPSVVTFNIAESTHKLYLDGGLAGVVKITEPAGLPQQSQAMMSGSLRLDKGVTLPAGGTVHYRLESVLQIRLYGDTMETMKLSASGTAPVDAK